MAGFLSFNTARDLKNSCGDKDREEGEDGEEGEEKSNTPHTSHLIKFD
jgi:hypothetical protein